MRHNLGHSNTQWDPSFGGFVFDISSELYLSVSKLIDMRLQIDHGPVVGQI